MKVLHVRANNFVVALHNSGPRLLFFNSASGILEATVILDMLDADNVLIES